MTVCEFSHSINSIIDLCIFFAPSSNWQCILFSVNPKHLQGFHMSMKRKDFFGIIFFSYQFQGIQNYVGGGGTLKRGGGGECFLL